MSTNQLLWAISRWLHTIFFCLSCSSLFLTDNDRKVHRLFYYKKNKVDSLTHLAFRLESFPHKNLGRKRSFKAHSEDCCKNEAIIGFTKFRKFWLGAITSYWITFVVFCDIPDWFIDYANCKIVILTTMLSTLIEQHYLNTKELKVMLPFLAKIVLSNTGKTLHWSCLNTMWCLLHKV